MINFKKIFRKFSPSSRGSYNFVNENCSSSKWRMLRKQALNLFSRKNETIPYEVAEEGCPSKIISISSNFFFEDVLTGNARSVFFVENKERNLKKQQKSADLSSKVSTELVELCAEQLNCKETTQSLKIKMTPIFSSSENQNEVIQLGVERKILSDEVNQIKNEKQPHFYENIPFCCKKIKTKNDDASIESGSQTNKQRCCKKNETNISSSENQNEETQLGVKRKILSDEVNQINNEKQPHFYENIPFCCNEIEIKNDDPNVENGSQTNKQLCCEENETNISSSKNQNEETQLGVKRKILSDEVNQINNEKQPHFYENIPFCCNKIEIKNDDPNVENGSQTNKQLCCEENETNISSSKNQNEETLFEKILSVEVKQIKNDNRQNFNVNNSFCCKEIEIKNDDPSVENGSQTNKQLCCEENETYIFSSENKNEVNLLGIRRKILSVEVNQMKNDNQQNFNENNPFCSKEIKIKVDDVSIENGSQTNKQLCCEENETNIFSSENQNKETLLGKILSVEVNQIKNDNQQKFNENNPFCCKEIKTRYDDVIIENNSQTNKQLCCEENVKKYSEKIIEPNSEINKQVSLEENPTKNSKNILQLVSELNEQLSLERDKLICCKKTKTTHFEVNALIFSELNKQLSCEENKTKFFEEIMKSVSEINKQLSSEKNKTKNSVASSVNLKIKKETVEEFIKKISKTDQKPDQINVVNAKIKIVNRTRRKIECGSYPNESVNENTLPKILRYVWKGKIKKLKSYLGNSTNRAKIDLVDSLGRSALHYAASWGCLRFVLYLLENGAEVNLQDSQGKTPLFKVHLNEYLNEELYKEAVEIRALQCIKVLMKNGADINIKCHDSRSPFDFAIQVYGDSEIDAIRFMYESIKNILYDAESLTYLHKLCLAKKNLSLTKVAEMLLEKEDMNGTEGLKRTPLMLAAKTNKKDIVKVLLKNNADVMLFDDNFKMAIHYCPENTEVYNLIKDAVIITVRTRGIDAASISKNQIRSNALRKQSL